MQIRRFTLEDYDEVVNLWRDSGLSIGQSDSYEEISKKLERDGDLFLVAEEDEMIVGAVIGAWDGRRAWIYHLAVIKERRDKNIGTALLAELEEKVKAKGALKINLLIERHNQGVQEFYSKQGYVTADVIYMSKYFS